MVPQDKIEEYSKNSEFLKEYDKIVSDFDKGVADVEDILKATLLYDFYGELLTQKQKDVFEYYYFITCLVNTLQHILCQHLHIYFY